MADLLNVIDKAEAFIAGFEDDETQEGIPELLAALRDARQDLVNPDRNVRFDVDGRRVEYADAADASEHRLRIQEAGGWEPTEHVSPCSGGQECMCARCSALPEDDEDEDADGDA